jgi:hypothetical protein
VGSRHDPQVGAGGLGHDWNHVFVSGQFSLASRLCWLLQNLMTPRFGGKIGKKYFYKSCFKDAVVARQYQDNFHIFKATAQHWAACYAGSNYKVLLDFPLFRF